MIQTIIALLLIAILIHQELRLLTYKWTLGGLIEYVANKEGGEVMSQEKLLELRNGYMDYELKHIHLGARK